MAHTGAFAMPFRILNRKIMTGDNVSGVVSELVPVRDGKHFKPRRRALPSFFMAAWPSFFRALVL